MPVYHAAQPRAGARLPGTGNGCVGSDPDVRILVTFMRRALHIGLFIGTLIGVSACATVHDGHGPQRGAYGSVDAGRTG
jgi:hypothetical protein